MFGGDNDVRLGSLSNHDPVQRTASRAQRPVIYRAVADPAGRYAMTMLADSINSASASNLRLKKGGWCVVRSHDTSRSSAQGVGRDPIGAGEPSTSERFRFLAIDPTLAKNAHQHATAYILRMRIGNPQLSATPSHVLVIAAVYGRLEAQSAQVCNQVSAFDRADGRFSGDLSDFDAVPVDLRNRRVIGNREKQPPFQHPLQSSRQPSRVFALAQTPGIEGISP